MRLSRSVWIGVAVVAGAICTVAAGGLAWVTWEVTTDGGSLERCGDHRRFVRREWLDSTQSRYPLYVRGCMVDDLLARHPWVGRSARDVTAFLGPPPPNTSPWQGNVLIYPLGPERGGGMSFAMDTEWLLFTLGPDNRVVKVELVVD